MASGYYEAYEGKGWVFESLSFLRFSGREGGICGILMGGKNGGVYEDRGN